MAGKKYAIGIDYGSNSVRALVVDTATGQEVGTAVYDYPSGVKGILLDAKDPLLARQNPADYIEGFKVSVTQALAQATGAPGFRPEQVVGIGIDTTGSTPIPVDAQGVPLAMQDKFKNNLNAHAWLWKDHTAHDEADEITRIAAEMKIPALAKIGGKYSAEWFWAKVWHCLKVAPEVFNAAESWVELADFVPAWITGNRQPQQIVRGICAAGHKCLFGAEWGGFPEAKFFDVLDPKLTALRNRLFTAAYPSDHSAGQLCQEFAAATGLPAGIPVTCGAFDCHHGAVGAGIKEGTLVNTMGTSACAIMVSPLEKKLADIPGLCGIVPGSVVPGMYGLESGQSAVGDLFAWFVHNLVPGEYGAQNVHATISEAAEKLRPGESGLLALDWNNGNRTVLVDQALTGLLVGQTLHTNAAEIFRALVEATAFGARIIIERHEEYGVMVREIIACGGIAEKNPFVMQLYADICNRPIKISRSAQTCALGAAVFGAVVGGAHKDVAAAQAVMCGVKDRVFTPIASNVPVYERLFKLYRQLHDAFAATPERPDLSRVMKELIAIRREVRGGEE